MMLAALAGGAGERLATSIISMVGAEGAKAPPDKNDAKPKGVQAYGIRLHCSTVYCVQGS